MLADFIQANRDEIIASTQARVAARPSAGPSDAGVVNGIPIFLGQLATSLRLAESTEAIDHQEIVRSAGSHGSDMVKQTGMTIAQVVHYYGDVCQVLTELALRHNEPIAGSEFRTLNLCLDDAIAGAVTEFAAHRERGVQDRGTERLGELAHEMRNQLNVAGLAFASIKRGTVVPGGSTGVLLDRSLAALRGLIDRSLADVRLDAGITRLQPICVAELLEEVEIGAVVHAGTRGQVLSISSVDRALFIEGDRQVVAAALANLLQNAFKFTPTNGKVTLRTRVSNGRVLFEVEDQCGGLPPGAAEELFLPFMQRGADRSGVGLGLSICQKAAKANGGALSVRDLPGQGCVFTLDLPCGKQVTPQGTA